MRRTVPSDGINNYTWDAESETKTVAGVTYTYDGLGDRVEKSNGTLYWYGPGGEILEETGLTGALKNDYVFFDGERIARKDSSGNDFYYVEDHLGSSRAITTANGVLCSDADFLPYGQEVDYTSGCAQNYKFEGKERDVETGNDNFGARYYRSLVGRWLSPDWSAIPAAVPYADLTNPQTLNLYAMTRDNPETFADLDGHVTGENGQNNNKSAQTSTTTCATQPSSGSNTSSCTTNNVSNANPAPTSQQALDKVQMLLDVATFIPVVGDVASGANAAISASRGDWKDAAISALAAVPVVGVVGEIGKVAKLGKEAEEGVKLGKGLASEAQMAEKGTEIAGGKSAREFRDADKWARSQGGKVSDYVKKSSSSYTAKDGTKFSTHWVENTVTGARTAFKTVIATWPF